MPIRRATFDWTRSPMMFTACPLWRTAMISAPVHSERYRHARKTSGLTGLRNPNIHSSSWVFVTPSETFEGFTMGARDKATAAAGCGGGVAAGLCGLVCGGTEESVFTLSDQIDVRPYLRWI